MTETDSTNYENRLVDLPIKENCIDEAAPEFMTSVVWEPMEHFIHNPERSLSEYGWSREELKQVNWHAIKIAWQRLWKRWHQEQGGYTVHLGGDGWSDEIQETLDFGEPLEAEEYDDSRVGNPEKMKEDYFWVREELINKFGKYNKDDFGLPNDLYS
ncbi:hypothetical protein A2382_01475 [Candidatus Woesebacteria bacterium RIFOXYB1_FULL_38_16]|uniref:Uncharacterized protein n=1 Tax=Candidatus Woesebacteria bacterium RIFOXYB1_FULL_38_16 TaxID=1802538 RepID=A0A1F8CTK2_9BACT|nr:MAG: hypothetical protein A2191_01760 [Candidatus Woesebacteria bacterium RIFOXYA1_FULL_38_9]OGM79068.1 MAG: hypothetical protein A2382_01475 [Candidatus Woesebacteria bacterium RIFOXYB1_FULL_38_16]